MQQAPAWQVELKLWKPEDPRYAGTDTAMSMKLTSFWFFCNRPTVAALIRLGTDMAAAARGADAAAAAPLPLSQADSAVDEQAMPSEAQPSAQVDSACPLCLWFMMSSFWCRFQ